MWYSALVGFVGYRCHTIAGFCFCLELRRTGQEEMPGHVPCTISLLLLLLLLLLIIIIISRLPCHSSQTVLALRLSQVSRRQSQTRPGARCVPCSFRTLDLNTEIPWARYRQHFKNIGMNENIHTYIYIYIYIFLYVYIHLCIGCTGVQRGAKGLEDFLRAQSRRPSPRLPWPGPGL